MQILKKNLREWIPHDLKKILGKKKHFHTSFEWIQSEDGFENYTVTMIFDSPSNNKKELKKKKIHNPICYINSFATLFLN